jgi:predicted GNAT family acetyltransferase
VAQLNDGQQVTDNEAESRFEAKSGGRLAELTYRRRGNRLVLLHTGVPAELEGHGVGGKLVAAAVDRATRDSLTIVPLCPFARSWLQRHKDVADRAAIDWG